MFSCLAIKFFLCVQASEKNCCMDSCSSWLYLGVSGEVPLELLSFSLWQKRIWSRMRCEESLKIDLHVFFIVKRVTCETSTVLGTWSIKAFSFHKAFRSLLLSLWKTELLMQMTAPSDFDANYQTRIFFIFYLSL